MFTLAAPAKINWFLSILGRRADGYHEILSIMQCLDLEDRLTFEQSDGLEVLTAADIPQQDNLVFKAGNLLRERFHVTAGARIRLDKETPLAAGLGGGSSDAAAALIGLNRLWSLGLSVADLAELGGLLGSDVPFFLGAPCAVVSGRGEKTEPLRLSREYALLLAKPDFGVSSAWAYGQAGVSGTSGELTKKRNNIKLFCLALEAGDFSILSSLQGNDLEPPVIKRYPVVAALKQGMLQRGALFASMSGSGPTVFGVFRDRAAAAAARDAIVGCWSTVTATVAVSSNSAGAGQ
jgi:4-diphosphocytidyl-2-C-methyl-D-erythritol kinase